MEETGRSGGSSGVAVKKRKSSGCLIVKKKGDGVGGSSSGVALNSKKEKKRRRLPGSHSKSSDEQVVAPRRRIGRESLQVCNGLNACENSSGEEDEIERVKNSLAYSRGDDDGMTRRNNKSETQRNVSRLDIFEFDEYDGVDGEKFRVSQFSDVGAEVGERRLLGSMHWNGDERVFKADSSRHMIDKRTENCIDRSGRFNRDSHANRSNHKDGIQVPVSYLRDKIMTPSDEPIRFQGKNGVLKVMVNKKRNMDVLESNDHRKCEENDKSSNDNAPKRNVSITPMVHSEIKYFKRRCRLITSSEKDQINSRISLPTNKGKGSGLDSDDSKNSLNPESESAEARKAAKMESCEVEKTPSQRVLRKTIKEGKIKRSRGTEKQKLREQIREMLINAGWTIDYRPRRNRDYLDAVYINPSGTAYWSIIKAYDALQKQSNGEDNEVRPSVDYSSFMPIADEVLSQLTRNTRKKIEKEFKKKQRDVKNSEKVKGKGGRKSPSGKYDVESMDSDEEKLSSFIKHGSKSQKNRVNENDVSTVNLKGQHSSNNLHDNVEMSSFGSNSRILQGKKRKKLGLLVRGSNKGPNSDDGFVPYTGKRTLLSWLIDSETVHLSQKVRYMNRRQTRSMLEGWVTRDGIHCSCCSKILTLSKFELHAGSKLRQPFQNIVLESGVSLLQCQIDAWNRQEESKRLSFYSIEIDGDDPNDDTCGICGDGGDLICCDGCPSTFHQSCLDIQIPPGDWHCPNCTCKFCGGGDDFELDDSSAAGLSVCTMCEKKYHISCIQDMDSGIRRNGLQMCFCGQKCRELFGQLQKHLGVKHDLDGGFSWSLIQRMDEDCDTSVHGLLHRVECNSKLAVALTVMDECFLPVVDRRSGINLIHNVLYNCGSNFNRLNYSGFYSAILERGDEIISVASIRFHGTKLVEMPYIGTRHIYRRQGMCRRLFCAIEAALCSFKVEKLIIPAISELMDTWTVVFGFTSLEESLKQEMRLMNMLVFPGTDMLQKQLSMDKNVASNSGGKALGSKGKQDARSAVPSQMETELSPKKDPGCDDTDLNHLNGVTDEITVVNSSSENLVVSAVVSNHLDTSHNVQASVLIEGAVNLDSHSEDKFLISDSELKLSASEMDNRSPAMETKPGSDSAMADCKSSIQFLDVSLNDNSLTGDASVAFSEVNIELSMEGNEVLTVGRINLKAPPSTYNNAQEDKNEPFSENNGNSSNNWEVQDTCKIDAKVEDLESTRPVENLSENHVDELGENPGAFAVSFNGANETPIEIKPLLNNKTATEVDGMMLVSLVAATDARHWNGKCLAASGESCGSDELKVPTVGRINIKSPSPSTDNNAHEEKNDPFSENDGNSSNNWEEQDTCKIDAKVEYLESTRPVENLSKNHVDEIGENPGASALSFNGASEIPIAIKTVLNNKTATEADGMLLVSSEAASDARHWNGKCLPASGESCGSYELEK